MKLKFIAIMLFAFFYSLTGVQVAAAAERINFCKYINRSDNANNSAPYESTGSEIRK